MGDDDTADLFSALDRALAVIAVVVVLAGVALIAAIALAVWWFG